jgi:hypothetical protein
MKRLTHWGAMAKKHWEEFRPRMVAHLKKEGVYEDALVNAQDRAAAMYGDQVHRGNNPESAKEMALQMFILLPEETREQELDVDRMPFSQPAPTTMWVPNLPLRQAAALAVSMNLPYGWAIFGKLIGLLDKAGADAASIVGAYLEEDSTPLDDLGYPEEWADEILLIYVVSALVAAGNPDDVKPADDELADAALKANATMSLEKFLSAAGAASA